MSGFLGSIENAAIDIVGLYGDGLIDAQFAGVSFWMINSNEQVGRRALRFLFPGSDTPAFQDLGAIAQPISIKGLYVGDDYVAQAAAFRAAFNVPATQPQTLVHPWLGTMQVVLASPASISFSDEELRVVRIELSLWPYAPPAAAPADTLSGLLASIENVKSAVTGFVSAVLGVQQLASGVISTVTGFAGNLAGAWNVLALTVSTDASGAPLTAAINQLGGIELVVPGVNYGAGVAPLLAAPSAAMATAANPPAAAVVAPGSVAAAPAVADPVLVTNTLLAAVTAIAALPASVSPGPALTATCLGYVVADCASVVTDISFTSQQDAAATSAQVLAAIDQASTLAAAQAALFPVPAGDLWRALVALRSSFAADMNAVIGRLPAVEDLVLPGPTSLWAVAQYLSGDTPANLVATYLDLRARNDVINPAIVLGTLEVLG